MTNVNMGVQNIISAVDTNTLLARPIHEWFPILSVDCQVYSCDASYLAKRFDEINYSFYDAKSAKEILTDNLYTLLRHKYFTQMTDEVNERISRIISSFTLNLRSVLTHVTFDNDISASTNARLVTYLPDGCVAFANGVYNFKNDNWLFKYSTVDIKKLHTKIYSYDMKYVVQWYLNFNFEPLPVAINNLTIEEAYEIFKELNHDQRNYCFELVHNMSHDSKHEFSMDRFKHLCEILGYTCLNSFCQSFIMLIGSGQNGKNSLFDGCFTNKLVPRPSAISFDSIETDRFVTGSLANVSHNIFLETSAKKYTESKMIKALTGSMYQSIEGKNISRYSGIINCKYMFAGNDRELIKFSDTTTGFLRRINMMEIFYTWDSDKAFMRKGDYFDTSFSDSLIELKSDVTNVITFVYLAMLGMSSATSNFTKHFKFTENDWSAEYTDIDLDLKAELLTLTPVQFCDYAAKSEDNKEEFKQAIFTMSTKRAYSSPEAKALGLNNVDDFITHITDEDENVVPATRDFFLTNDVYVSIRFLQKVIRNTSMTPNAFTQTVKKAFNIVAIPFTYRNMPYVKMTMKFGNTFRIIKD